MQRPNRCKKDQQNALANCHISFGGILVPDVIKSVCNKNWKCVQSLPALTVVCVELSYNRPDRVGPMFEVKVLIEAIGASIWQTPLNFKFCAQLLTLTRVWFILWQALTKKKEQERKQIAKLILPDRKLNWVIWNKSTVGTFSRRTRLVFVTQGGRDPNPREVSLFEAWKSVSDVRVTGRIKMAETSVSGF